MKYIFPVIAALSLSLTTQAQDALSTWTKDHVTIDGRADEWPQFFRFYAPGTKFQFDVMNDSANIYVCVRATEVDGQARLMHSGLTIWVDPSGKKKQKEGFSFPVRIDRTPDEKAQDQEMKRVPGEAQSQQHSLRSRTNRLRERVLLSQNAIKIMGMSGITEPLLPMTNPSGLNVAYAWDSLEILFVEYQIPLALVYGRAVTAADMNQPIGLGLVAGAIDAEVHHVGNPGGTGAGMTGQGSNRGMGGRPGGMTGQGNTMSGTAYDPNNSEQKTWLKLHLETGK